MEYVRSAFEIVPEDKASPESLDIACEHVELIKEVVEKLVTYEKDKKTNDEGKVVYDRALFNLDWRLCKEYLWSKNDCDCDKLRKFICLSHCLGIEILQKILIKLIAESVRREILRYDIQDFDYSSLPFHFLEDVSKKYFLKYGCFPKFPIVKDVQQNEKRNKVFRDIRMRLQSFFKNEVYPYKAIEILKKGQQEKYKTGERVSANEKIIIEERLRTITEEIENENDSGKETGNKFNSKVFERLMFQSLNGKRPFSEKIYEISKEAFERAHEKSFIT